MVAAVSTLTVATVMMISGIITIINIIRHHWAQHRRRHRPTHAASTALMIVLLIISIVIAITIVTLLPLLFVVVFRIIIMIIIIILPASALSLSSWSCSLPSAAALFNFHEHHVVDGEIAFYAHAYHHYDHRMPLLLFAEVVVGNYLPAAGGRGGVGGGDDGGCGGFCCCRCVCCCRFV